MEKCLMITFILSTAFAVAFSYPNQFPGIAPQRYNNVPKCLQPPAAGLCLAYFPSYYYEPSTETCKSFVYGGCQGNENRFVTEAECLAACSGFKPDPAEGFKLIVEPVDVSDESNESPIESDGNQVDPCKLSFETGPCKANMPRFYFSGDKCEEFVYGGCQGNENNFKTVEECQQKCASNPSAEEKSETDE